MAIGAFTSIVLQQAQYMRMVRANAAAAFSEVAPPNAGPSPIFQVDSVEATQDAGPLAQQILAQDAPRMGMRGLQSTPGVRDQALAQMAETKAETERDLEVKRTLVNNMLARGSPNGPPPEAAAACIHKAAAAFTVSNLALLDRVGTAITIVPPGQPAMARDTAALSPAHIGRELDTTGPQLQRVFDIVDRTSGPSVAAARDEFLHHGGDTSKDEMFFSAGLVGDTSMSPVDTCESSYQTALQQREFMLRTGLEETGLSKTCTDLSFRSGIPGVQKDTSPKFLTAETLAHQHGARTPEEIHQFVDLFGRMNGPRLETAQKSYAEEAGLATDKVPSSQRPFNPTSALVAPNYYLMRQSDDSAPVPVRREEVDGFHDWESGNTLGYFRPATQQVLLRQEQLESTTPPRHAGDPEDASWTVRHELTHGLHHALAIVDPEYVKGFNQRLAAQHQAQQLFDFRGVVADPPQTSFPSAYGSTKPSELLPEDAAAWTGPMPLPVIMGGPHAVELVTDFLHHAETLPP